MIEGDLITITDSGKYTKVSKKSQKVIGVFTKEGQGLNLGEVREGMVLQVTGFVSVRCKGKAKAGDFLGIVGRTRCCLSSARVKPGRRNLP